MPPSNYDPSLDVEDETTPETESPPFGLSEPLSVIRTRNTIALAVIITFLIAVMAWVTAALIKGDLTEVKGAVTVLGAAALAVVAYLFPRNRGGR